MTVRLLYFTLCAFIFLFQINIYALESNVLEFKTEHDKGVWIKNYFKDKKINMLYPVNATKEAKTLKYQFIQDFINQNNVQNIEPIAVGKSILDPAIAQYNTACPEQKPIDLYKKRLHLLSDEFLPEERDKLLEDPKDEYDTVTDIYRCRGNIKIYKLYVAQGEKKEQYVLYCDDLVSVRLIGKWMDINRDTGSIATAHYLLFDPRKCMYTQSIFDQWLYGRNVINGIMKYKNQYYFYSYHESESSVSKKYEGDIWIQSLSSIPRYNFFYANIIIGE